MINEVNNQTRDRQLTAHSLQTLSQIFSIWPRIEVEGCEDDDWLSPVIIPWIVMAGPRQPRVPGLILSQSPPSELRGQQRTEHWTLQSQEAGTGISPHKVSSLNSDIYGFYNNFRLIWIV